MNQHKQLKFSTTCKSKYRLQESYSLVQILLYRDISLGRSQFQLGLSQIFYSGGIPDSMTGCYRIAHDHVICVVKKNNYNSNLTNNVLKYQRSAKSKNAIQYVFEVPDQVFHFVSTFD